MNKLTKQNFPYLYQIILDVMDNSSGGRYQYREEMEIPDRYDLQELESMVPKLNKNSNSFNFAEYYDFMIKKYNDPQRAEESKSLVKQDVDPEDCTEYYLFTNPVDDTFEYLYVKYDIEKLSDFLDDVYNDVSGTFKIVS